MNAHYVDFLSFCYKVMQVFMVTGLFAGQHNTGLHGTNAGVLLVSTILDYMVQMQMLYTQLLDQLC